MTKKVQYDFGGYVTKNDLKCTDGRTIRHGAFAECDGKRVPLVFMHNHRELNNVLGFVDLEAREDGVYGHGCFNDSPEGQAAKTRVLHGDLAQMSIYANQLKERGKEVFHGVIREVSLVLAGANPGAVIDNLNLVHSDGSFDLIEDEAIIKPGIDIEFMHSDDEDEAPLAESEAKAVKHADDETAGENQNDGESDSTVSEVVDSMNEDQKAAMQLLVGIAAAEGSGEEVPELSEEDSAAIKAALDSMNEEQQTVLYFLVGKAEEDAENKAEGEKADGEMEQSAIEEGEDNMTHMNVFEQNVQAPTRYLTQEETAEIFHMAQNSGNGSLKDAWNAYAAAHDMEADSLMHGITNIEAFFPEAQAVGPQPAMISRRMEWVAGVLAAVHKTPFSKVKSMAANLTAEEARAKGYIKGTKKIEEQIAALKRVTNPTTIYKLQKLDRDDVIDIVDFDVVAWLRAEMRMMLEEEVARAYLIGDGRTAGANDKIDESCIRPIWTDAETYAIHQKVDDDQDPSVKAKNFIDAAIRARKYYKGSGSPVLYVGQDLLTEMRLIRDEIGHRLYKNDQELADELRVSKIVEVELFDGQTREVDNVELELGGIIVNLSDYNVGATRGGEVNMFDDFDLNFNKYEYLIETRQSGALVQPASALVLEFA